MRHGLHCGHHELRQLWNEGREADREAWRAGVSDLLARLQVELMMRRAI
jgi:hypothetical protein